MHEERAILLGRLKRHEQALAIYTNVLRDYKEAENYCKINYDRQDPENSKVQFSFSDFVFELFVWNGIEINHSSSCL
ncbi:unnamed protein product [Anisakis simplex]|uniref:Vam6/Vps39-like protein (inferred by orthology to a human protein) n=1 Tax=Anisakis simplex TaxID=6269 RepID=A0A0M3JIP6_ANISI|nr:unnamed protein product [Anisakis simplex]